MVGETEEGAMWRAGVSFNFYEFCITRSSR